MHASIGVSEREIYIMPYTAPHNMAVWPPISKESYYHIKSIQKEKWNLACIFLDTKAHLSNLYRLDFNFLYSYFGAENSKTKSRRLHVLKWAMKQYQNRYSMKHFVFV